MSPGRRSIASLKTLRASSYPGSPSTSSSPRNTDFSRWMAEAASIIDLHDLPGDALRLALSLLRSDLPCEGLSNNLAVSNDERVGGRLVNVVWGFGTPDDVGVVTLDRHLLHGERRTRLSEV